MTVLMNGKTINIRSALQRVINRKRAMLCIKLQVKIFKGSMLMSIVDIKISSSFEKL